MKAPGSSFMAAVYKFHCRQCQKESFSKRQWAKFCGPKCRQQWNKEEWAWTWVRSEMQRDRNSTLIKIGF